MITKQTIVTVFKTPAVVRVGSKQLFIVTLPDKKAVLVSYLTVIGYLQDGVWHITDKQCSKTTTAHITHFARTNQVRRVAASEFEKQLQTLGGA